MSTVPESDTEPTTSILTRWLSSRLPESSTVTVGNVRIPQVGYSGETIIFDARWTAGGTGQQASFVARLQPSGGSFFFDTDISIHYRFLEQIADTPIRSPRPLWFEQADGSDFERAFFVMEALPGRTPPEKPHYTVSGWLADLSAADQAHVYRGALHQIATVHRTPWAAMDLSFLPVMATGGPGMSREVALFEEFSELTLNGRQIPVLEEARDWVLGHIPDSDRFCLSWGDPKFSNILYDGQEPSGLLDWELASVAPPESDVAFWLVHHDSVTGGAGHPELPGFPDEDNALNWYEQESGIRLQSLDFYTKWHRYRIAVMTLRLADLLVERGRLRPDPDRITRMRAMNDLARSLAA